MWPMPNVMAVLPNIGGALFSTPQAWLTPAAGLPCSDSINIGERKTWTQSEFCAWQNSVRGQESPKCIYSAAAQETDKHSAKFG